MLFGMDDCLLMINDGYVCYYWIVGCLSLCLQFLGSSRYSHYVAGFFTEFFLELRKFSMHDIIYHGTCVKEKKNLSPLF